MNIEIHSFLSNVGYIPDTVLDNAIYCSQLYNDYGEFKSPGWHALDLGMGQQRRIVEWIQSHCCPTVSGGWPRGLQRSGPKMTPADAPWYPGAGAPERGENVKLAAGAVPWFPVRAANSPLCMHFSRGYCRAGDGCLFQHPFQDASEQPFTPPSIPQALPCKFYLMGNCIRGDCPFSHVAAPNPTVSPAVAAYAQTQVHNQLHATATVTATTATAKVCRYFAMGHCKSGTACQYSHDAPIPTAPFGTYAAAAKDADGELTADVTGFTGRCRFGAGLLVLDIQCTPSATAARPVRRVIVTGLHALVSDEHIASMMAKIGTVAPVQRKHASYAFVDFQAPDDAATAVSALNGSRLSIWNTDVAESSAKGGTVGVRIATELGGVALQNAAVKVLWYRPEQGTGTGRGQGGGRWQWQERERGQRPGRGFFGRGFGRAGAAAAAFVPFREDKRTKGGRGRGRGGPDTSVDFSSDDDDDGTDVVRRLLEEHGPLASFEKAATPTPTAPARGRAQTQGDPNKRKALVKFAFSEDALRAVAAISKRHREPALGGTKLFVESVFTAKFTLLNAVYEAIEADLKAVAASTPANVQMRMFPGEKTTVVRVSAGDSNALSRMRSQLQGRHFSGERVLDNAGRVLWHESFESSAEQADAELRRVGDKTGCVVVSDRRRKVLLIYGGTKDSRALAQASLLSFVASASCQLQRFAVPCPPLAWKPLLLQGLTALKEATGASMVSLDISKRGLVVEGDGRVASSAAEFLAQLAQSPSAAAQQTGQIAHRVPSKSTVNSAAANTAAPKTETVHLREAICPVCLCPAGDEGDQSDPPGVTVVQLACSHVYCRSCYLLLLTQITDGDSSCGSKFPISCYADKCGKHMSIRDIKAHAPPSQFAALLRASLESHVLANIASYRSCPTPNCTNIHRAPITNSNSGSSTSAPADAEASRAVYCSSCRTTVCTVCEAEEHEGLTCAQYRMETAPPNVMRNKIHEEVLTLKCPRCKKAFLDFDGCFALKCSNCPCSFCGWCLADCGSDAHSHVKDCRHKLNKDTFFGTQTEFRQAMRTKMTADLKAVLLAMEQGQRQEVLQVLADDLRDLGIDEREFVLFKR